MFNKIKYFAIIYIVFIGISKANNIIELVPIEKPILTNNQEKKDKIAKNKEVIIQKNTENIKAAENKNKINNTEQVVILKPALKPKTIIIEKDNYNISSNNKKKIKQEISIKNKEFNKEIEKETKNKTIETPKENKNKNLENNKIDKIHESDVQKQKIDNNIKNDIDKNKIAIIKEKIEEKTVDSKNNNIETVEKKPGYMNSNFKNINRKNNGNLKVVPTTKVVKSVNYEEETTIGILNKIEKNLKYNKHNEKNSNDKNIDIKKGGWSKKDLIEVKVSEDKTKTTKSKTIEMENKETQKSNKIAKLKERAYEAINLKEYEIGLKLYKEILDIDPKDNFTKLSLATTYHLLGQYTQAKPLYIELLSVFPNSEQLVSNLLSIIIQESPYEAIYLLPSLAEQYNSSATIQAQTSIAFSTIERYKEAIKYIQKAIAIDPENIEYLYNLAVLYDSNKQYDKAYRNYSNLLLKTKNNKDLIPYKDIELRIKKLKKYV